MKSDPIYLQLLAENKINPDTVSLSDLDYDPKTDFPGLMDLVKSLITNDSVKTLDLMNCQLTDLQLNFIAPFLFKNKSIVNFLISHNKLTDNSGELLYDLVEEKKIEIISLHNNQFNQATKKMLEEAILSNKAHHSTGAYKL